MQAAKPATPMRQIGLSAPPATITSASSMRDQARGVADGVRARRAGGDDGVVGALEPVPDRDVARGQIDQPSRDEERADAARALSPSAAATVSAMPVRPPMPEPIMTPVRSCFSGVSAFQPESSSACCGRRHGVDDEVVDLALLLGLHPVVGIELALAERRRAARSSRSGRRGRRPGTPRCGARRSGPAIRRDQLASTPHPSGVTRPSPVMTTRRNMHGSRTVLTASAMGAAR